MLSSNGARLIRLIVDVGTKTLRNHFDSIHPPETLTNVLYVNYHTLRRRIPFYQMRTLFPPAGDLPATPSTPTSSSGDYDITLLFSLLCNICGLHPPASIYGGTSWDENPPLDDESREADLARIKFYRNEAFAHIRTTDVSDGDFVIYWNVISRALIRLGANAEKIKDLETRPLVEKHYLNLITETRKYTRTIKTLVFLILAMLICCLALFLPRYFPKEPDYPYPQNFSNPGFVGREWVFQLIEHYSSKTRGVLFVADPGWGKSAIVKQLISSSSSSAVIHDNIIGFHICKFNDKSTRDGGRFVKNLVQLIGNEIHEYKRIINSNHLIEDILKSNCNDNPVECFETAVVKPLQNLDSTGRKNSFILIDALDECLEKEESHQSIIINILNKNVPYLPNWVKLIVTSRNQLMCTSNMLKIGLLNLTPRMWDTANKRDLHMYANQTLQNLIDGTSSNEEILRIQQLIDHALKFCKGNFLFLKTVIKNWQLYPDKMNIQSIPESLEDLYATSFTQRF